MERNLLTISEFSRLSGISRKTLIFYDAEGVFSPAAIAKNRYRRYSLRQLPVANVIVALRAIHVPLEQIKTFLSIRSPKRLIDLCQRQDSAIAAEIDKLKQIRTVIQSVQSATESAANAKAGRIGLETLPATRLNMGRTITSKSEDAINHGLADFYDQCVQANIPITNPLGALVKLDESAPYKPHRFYCPAVGTGSSAITRPGGVYAVGYAHGDYGMLDSMYDKMLRWIRKKGYAARSDAYEEYVLNEMALANPDSYLTRIAIQIHK